MEIERVRQICLQVRSAIEAISPHDLPITFSNFPNGACGDTCLLLGTYLEDQCGVPAFEYVSGERGSHSDNTWTSHAWLQRGELVIDITADQFADAPMPVVVASPSPWHHGFSVESSHPANLKAWYGPGTYDVLRLYARVCRMLAESVPNTNA
jgi:hypothetical protein